MRDYNYEASTDSIGEGWSDVDAAAKRWNNYIAPVLADATTDEMIDNDDEPVVSVIPGIGQLASEWAWEEFCGREAGESDELAEKLAADLEEKLK